MEGLGLDRVSSTLFQCLSQVPSFQPFFLEASLQTLYRGLKAQAIHLLLLHKEGQSI